MGNESNKYTKVLIIRQEVNGDVMDAVNADQVNPPGGGTFVTL